MITDDNDGRVTQPWVRVLMLAMMSEIDRLTYMVWRGDIDDLITGEPASDGHQHTIINGSHGCSCDEAWFPPPAESWTLPS